MNDLALSVRLARPEDAADLARIYIESWQDTYAGTLSHAVLGGMSLKRISGNWQSTIKSADKAGGAVLVAEDARHGAIGLCSLGPARDTGLGLEGEIYTLYVDPSFLGQGTGRVLLAGAFEVLKARKLRSCLVWAHARNNACYFYEAMGGKRVGARTTRLLGELTPETGFGWRQLAAQTYRRVLPS